MNEIVNYLRQEHGHFPGLVGQFDAVLSLELSSHLLVKGVSVPYKSDQKVSWLWNRESIALSVSVCFQLLLLKELWRPTRKHDRVVTLKGK